MPSKEDLKKEVFAAAREQGISSVLFRNAIARRLGLNITDSECFSLLSIRGISTPTEVAHYTGLTSGSTTAMLDRLEKAGFITRKPNPQDRRGTLIEITKQSTIAFGPLVANAQKSQSDLIASYSDKELGIIADFLTRFTQNVKEHTKKIEKGV